MDIAGVPANVQDTTAETLRRSLYQNGVICVAGAGNNRLHDLSLKQPVGSGGANTELIVVGAAQLDGERADFSTYIDIRRRGILSLYALGEGVCGASSNSIEEMRCVRGTSPATATIAGLVAYHLANPVIRNQMITNSAGEISYSTMGMRMKRFLQTQGTDQKGTWPDGIPRAAMNEEVICTPATGTATAPAAVSTDFGIYLYRDSRSIFNDPGFFRADGTLRHFVPALNVISTGLTLTLPNFQSPVST